MTSAPIAVTVGEPAGVGPEIAVKAWQALAGSLEFFWIGDPRHLPQGSAWREITDPAETADVIGSALPVLRHEFAGSLTPGVANPAHAAAVVAVIKHAVDLARSGAVSAICTCPINKKALKDGAGFAFPGHTEFLAHLSDTGQVVMMLACETLKVVPATIHIPLADVPATLTSDLLESTIRVTANSLKQDFGLTNPQLAISGLNPHAGEGGAMGRQEAEIIAPVVQKLAAEGYALTGPHPADTMFHAAARTRYDAAIAMYHDQALIPIKTLDFDHGVNVTLGLPFIRTSPDHGTAFDIAGTGQANPSSLIEALRLAGTMAHTRRAG